MCHYLEHFARIKILPGEFCELYVQENMVKLLCLKSECTVLKLLLHKSLNPGHQSTKLSLSCICAGSSPPLPERNTSPLISLCVSALSTCHPAAAAIARLLSDRSGSIPLLQRAANSRELACGRLDGEDPGVFLSVL